MRRTKRNTHRRPAGLVLKRTDRPSRFAFHFLAVLGILVLAGAVFSNFLMPGDTQSSIDFSAAGVDIRHGSDLSEMNATGPDAELPVAEAPREPEITRMTEVIKNGDTPSSLLEGCMALPDIYNLCNQSKDVFPLNNIRAGRSWTMIYSDEALVGLEYEISSDERLVVSMTDSGYEFRRETIPFEMETKTVSGVIESSLLGAIAKIGENDELGVRLANVFAYDVDFTRDLREGDSFKAIVEKKTRNGKFIGYGEILAASFSNREQTYYAYSYTGANGDTAYYDENGHPLRKAFLKSPLAFSRISSGYSMNRLHPVLKYRRPHQGIDYAAPTGTPIYTVADGSIAQVGYNKSQGRFIRIRHPNGYETIYNHMSKFAGASKQGAKVKQGQTIVYVGSTGLATGSHLDFRMRLNGNLINPLKIKSVPGKPIPKQELPDFMAAIASLRLQLEEPVRSAALEQPVPSVQ